MPKYTIRIEGHGGEFVAGIVSQESFDYFEELGVDINDYAEDSDNSLEVPEESQPFYPGDWFECDNLVHDFGAEYDADCTVTVEDEEGNEVFSDCVASEELKECEEPYTEVSVGLEAFETFDCGQKLIGKPVYLCWSFEKGLLFQGELVTDEPFDPARLFLWQRRLEDLTRIVKVQYGKIDDKGFPVYVESELLDNVGGDTTIKSREHRLVMAGGNYDMYDD